MAHLRCGRSLLRELVKDKSVPNCSCIIHPMLFVGQGIRYRKLEVILTTSIEKLGKAGETVKVAPGYFRNHLMPKLLAVPNIEKYAYLMREQRKGLRRFINVDNELRSPVTKDELVAEVARQLGVSIQLENLHLPSPLTTLGEFEVPLKLPKSIPLPEGKLHWSLKVKVRRK
ncbi:ribosomal protein L9/RNase H1 isoform X3 [Tasmannia lanceolata]|uniref:ribosomal protein L9/RNase H1 isoform X3 n=1 Tax=Tasmannia lanceolata TaxID=3420 RepID=UPI004063C983